MTDIQVGDIVFIESQSSQSPYIKLGTMSKWTHCGVVVDTPDGLKVLEASKTVKLTPFNTFIGRAKDDNWCVRRTNKQLYIIQSRDKMTINEFASEISKYCYNAVNLDMGRWGYGWIGKRTLCPWAIVFRHWQTNWIYCN